MPIFYNFYILLATIYMIFLDYYIDPVPSACSCLLHVFCFIENPYQTESKRDKNLQTLFWNICELLEVESMQGSAWGAHKP